MSEHDHVPMDDVSLAPAQEQIAPCPPDDRTGEIDPPAIGEEEEIDPRPGRPLSAETLAIQAELEIIGPVWCQTTWAENPEVTNEQASALLAGKLNEARRRIPFRWIAEPRFSDLVRLAEQNLENVDQLLTDLKAKDAADDSAQIEQTQARRLLADWEECRRPEIEMAYQEAARVWYKPGSDPLTRDLSTLVNRFANVGARLEFEVSKRPQNRVRVNPDQPLAPTMYASKTIVQFDAASLVEAFHGNIDDPEVLLRFSTWKSAWNSLVQEMETLRGFNQVTLFQKLCSCLKGPALKMVTRYSAESTNSYEAAMKDLLEKYENPISLAGSYVDDGMLPRKSVGEQAEAIRHALNALHNMRDVFEREKVDLYDFALMRTFITALPAETQALWTTYKIQRKQDYLLKCESSAKEGKSLPVWKAGMVENHEQFDSWLRLIGAQFNQPTPMVDQTQVPPTSSASNFALAGRQSKRTSPDPPCFLCAPQAQNHSLGNCRKGLAMSRTAWNAACREKSRCFRCANAFLRGHRCHVVCPTCIGNGYDASHISMMCPRNPLRRGTLGKEDKVPHGTNRPRPHPAKRNALSEGEGSLAKWAKDMTVQMKSLADQMAKVNQASDQVKQSGPNNDSSKKSKRH